MSANMSSESQFMTSTSLLATVAASLVSFLGFICYYQYTNAFTFWDKLGIKGPKPWPIFGNSLEFFLRDPFTRDNELMRKYGKVYGIYLGTTPKLIVADPEVAQQMSVKDFDLMPNHHFNGLMNKYQEPWVLLLKDDHWKKVRALMTPTFTSGKIKRMFKLLDACANDLVQCFREQIETPKDAKAPSNIVSTYDIYSLYAMDGVTTCLYGLKLERSGADCKAAARRNDFVRMALDTFKVSIPRAMASVMIPKDWLQKFDYTLNPVSNFREIVDKTSQLIVARRKSKKKFDDFLQMLVDAKLGDELELGEMDDQENHHAGLTQESLRTDQMKFLRDVENSDQSKSPIATANADDGPTKGATTTPYKLTDLEILSNAILFLIVGVETTGNFLTNATHALAFNPDIQDKLYQEIKAIAKQDENTKHFMFDYETLTSCRYLDAVISEVFRFMPVVLQTDRRIDHDYRIEKYGFNIPRGTELFFNLNSLGRDCDTWDSPDKFDPNRFMPGEREKIIPGSYVPFGMGPRHCIGMRFSLTESKLALAKILMHFRFEPAPGTTFPPKTKFHSGLNSLKMPLVKTHPRTMV